MPCDLGSLVTLERPGQAWMEPIEGVGPSTYRLQGDCSANWAISAYIPHPLAHVLAFQLQLVRILCFPPCGITLSEKGLTCLYCGSHSDGFPSEGGLPTTPYVSEPLIGSLVRFSLTAISAAGCSSAPGVLILFLFWRKQWWGNT